MANQVETIINVQLENRDKKTVFWRGILAVPVVVFVIAFTPMADEAWATGLIILPVVLALVVRGIYPSYVLSFNHGLIELETRLVAYVLLLTDDYPSIERNPNIAVLLPDVDGGKKLKRFMPLVKWILAIPLVIVGLVYALLALVTTFIAWIVTWSTGTYPRWALDIVLGTVKFWNRVYGYAILLVTDEYPGFSLS
jgi:fatty acid desaturase